MNEPKRITRRAFLRNSAGAGVALSTPAMVWFLDECRKFFAHRKYWHRGPRYRRIIPAVRFEVETEARGKEIVAHIKACIESSFEKWIWEMENYPDRVPETIEFMTRTLNLPEGLAFDTSVIVEADHDLQG